uniref:Uncharacterized protein n=1 Tax=Nothobranchius furzeri TaxID=105023 RepID=A0A8C6L9H4_NOTFU
MDNSTRYNAYLSDLRHHFQRCPGMTLEDKIFLIRLTSDVVGSFIDRKCNAIGNDYNRLETAIRKEYTYDAKEAGVRLALSVKQGGAEDPQAFYLHLFDAYFDTECKDRMEEENGFKEMFLENLKAQYSPYMGTVDIKTTPIDELRRMASCAFRRFKDSSKSSHAPLVLAVGADPSTLRLEGTASGTRKNDNCNNGSEQQAQKSNNNSKPKGFPKTSLKIQTDFGPLHRLEEAGPAEAEPTTTVHALTPETLARSGVVASVSASPLAPTESATGPGQPSSPIRLPQRVLCSIICKGPTDKPHIPVTLEGALDCEGVLDSGSDFTIMSSSLWEQVRLAAAAQGLILGLTPCTVGIHPYSTSQMTLSNVVSINFTVGDMSVSHPEFVTNAESFPFLLGVDLIQCFEDGI